VIPPKADRFDCFALETGLVVGELKWRWSYELVLYDDSELSEQSKEDLSRDHVVGNDQLVQLLDPPYSGRVLPRHPGYYQSDPMTQ
jgi:hypothetical protein